MEQGAPHDMYFVAILCPQPVNEKVLQFKHWMKERFGCQVALKSPAHITLLPPFWFNHAKELLLLQTLQSFESNLEELVIATNGFSHFGKRVLFVSIVENNGLRELKTQVEMHFVKGLSESIQKDNRPFYPHITIANRDLKPSGFENAWQQFYKREFNETFFMKSIHLFKLSSGSWKVIGEKQW